jgi:hypothetical protein
MKCKCIDHHSFDLTGCAGADVLLVGATASLSYQGLDRAKLFKQHETHKRMFPTVITFINGIYLRSVGLLRKAACRPVLPQDFSQQKQCIQWFPDSKSRCVGLRWPRKLIMGDKVGCCARTLPQKAMPCIGNTAYASCCPMIQANESTAWPSQAERCTLEHGITLFRSCRLV